MSEKKWELKSREGHAIADTGDYGDYYWEIINRKGDAIRTTEDYDDIEKDLQIIVDKFNVLDVSVETSYEINQYIENSQLKDKNRLLLDALQNIISNEQILGSGANEMKKIAREALNNYNKE